MNGMKRFQRALLPVLLPVVSYLILGPLEIFFGNATEFNFAVSDFLLPQLALALVVWLGGSALLALLPPKAFRLGCTLVVAFGLCSYLQNMFLNGRLTEIDGNALRWDTIDRSPVLNGLIWLVIFAALLAAGHFFAQYWGSACLALPGFLSAIQLVATLSLFFTPAGHTAGEMQLSGEKQLSVAKDENIIVFVLDTFSNDHFENAKWLYPDMVQGFEDFTRYDNADCGYYNTFPSMTHLLTGAEYDFEAESQESWLKTAWESERAERFYTALHKAGYTCRLFSPDVVNYGAFDNLSGRFDNVEFLKKQVNSELLLARLTKMSAFRYLPYLCKAPFEVLTKEFSDVVSIPGASAVLEDNVEYFDALRETGLSVEKETPKAFIVEHLFGVHGPYTTAPDCTRVEETGPDQAASGCFTFLREYLNQLRELELYENSTIIITADHGNFGYGGLQPICFVKRAGEQHEEMQVNSAPISHCDFQATILAFAGADGGDFGTSILDWQPGQTRERSLFRPTQDSEYPLENRRAGNDVYYRYDYSTDGAELKARVEAGPNAVFSELERY